MPSNIQRRDEQVGAFFAAHADGLKRAARRRVDRVGAEVIETPARSHGQRWCAAPTSRLTRAA